MRIVTSYYTRLDSLDTTGCVIFRVSQSKPNWFLKKCAELPEVYPSWDIIRGIKDGSISEEEYIEQYDTILTDEVISSVKEKIQRICEEAGAKIAILTCWEGKNKFCHRHYLGKKLDPECVELP